MNKSNTRIDPADAVILFADLQAGIVERTQATRRKTLLISGVATETDYPGAGDDVAGEAHTQS